MKYFFSSIILLLLISCEKEKNKFDGVYIFQGKFDINRPKDTLQSSDLLLYEVLFDFKSNNKLFLKRHGLLDTVFKWGFEDDSILTIDTVDYKLYSYNSNSFTLIDDRYYDTYLLKFIKPQKVDLKMSAKEIKKVLLTKMWSREGHSNYKNYKYGSNIEYVDNSIMYFKDRYSSETNVDTITQYHTYYWDIEDYEGYMFYVQYNSGIAHKIQQISSFSQNEFSLIENKFDQNEIKYYAKQILKQNHEIKNLLLGKWKSYNLLENNDGFDVVKQKKHTRELIEFEGELNLEISENKFKYFIEGLPSIEYNWKLSNDGESIILFKASEIGGRPNMYFYQISRLKSDNLEFKLNRFYPIGKYKPTTLLLNEVQEFHRVNDNIN